MTRIVNSRAISVIGLIFGMNSCSYHVRPSGLDQNEPREHAGQERNAQVDEHALGDLADASPCTSVSFDGQGSRSRQERDEEVGVNAVEEAPGRCC